MFVFTLLACAAVGLIIGWTGIAGFLLPPLFISAMKCTTTEALFLSFSCFLVSGLIGSVNYARRGEIDRKTALCLCIPSLPGAAAGALLGTLLSQREAKAILYAVVFLSGLTCLIREFIGSKEESGKDFKPLWLTVIGFCTAILCSISGAGGPIIVMPLLVALGVAPRRAVALALLDSVFIAIPAIAVYGSGSMNTSLFPLLLASVACHAVGIEIGSHSAAIIPQSLLKRATAVFSICFSIVMLYRMLR